MGEPRGKSQETWKKEGRHEWILEQRKAGAMRIPPVRAGHKTDG